MIKLNEIDQANQNGFSVFYGNIFKMDTSYNINNWNYLPYTIADFLSKIMVNVKAS